MEKRMIPGVWYPERNTTTGCWQLVRLSDKGAISIQRTDRPISLPFATFTPATK